jgi:hypothetical protein
MNSLADKPGLSAQSHPLKDAALYRPGISDDAIGRCSNDIHLQEP